jgi:hypothetical protein
MTSIEKLIQTKLTIALNEEKKRIASSLVVSEDMAATMQRRQKKAISIQKMTQNLANLQSKVSKSKDPSAMQQKILMMRQKMQLAQTELSAIKSTSTTTKPSGPSKPKTQKVAAPKPAMSESVLNEADPRPRVEKDHRGMPVIPTKEQFQQYFEDMKAEHIQALLKDTHARWEEAVKKNDTPNVEALNTELAVGHQVLQDRTSKQVAEALYHVRHTVLNKD